MALIAIKATLKGQYQLVRQSICDMNECLSILLLRYINTLDTNYQAPWSEEGDLLDRLKNTSQQDQLLTHQLLSTYIDTSSSTTREEIQIKAVVAFLLGCYYDRVENDITKAIDLWQLAADGDNAVAFHNLACCYERGIGFSVDINKALALYRLAAKQSYSKALNNLGIYYYNGTGVERDDIEALKYYTLSYQLGNLSSVYNLAIMYESGRGVNKNIHTAVKLYREAAERGHIGAIYNLVLCLRYVPETNGKSDEIFELIRANVVREDPDSMRLLGYWLIKGNDCIQDVKQGYALIKKANNCEYDYLIKALQTI